MYKYTDERLVKALVVATVLTLYRDPLVRRAAEEIVKWLRSLAEEQERTTLEELYVEMLAPPR